MMSGGRANWQTIIADLALILFMVTASSLDAPGGAEESLSAEERDTLPTEGEMLALYRAHSSAPSLGQWLADQAPDERQNLTIVARFERGGREAAMAGAEELATTAGTHGLHARIVLEPGDHADLFAVLSFDGR